VTKHRVVIGIGTIIMIGVGLFGWKRSAGLKKRAVEDAYYYSLNERDIAWG